MGKRTYYRQPETAFDLYDRIEALEDSGEIDTSLAMALHIAVAHQSQLDYDGLKEVYDEAEGDLKDLLEDTGVILLLTEEQTKRVKYGA